MSNLKLGPRMALAFGAVLALMVLTIGLAMWRMQVTTSDMQAMLDEPLAKERLIGDWYRLVHTGVRRTTAIARSSDASLVPLFADEVKASTAQAGELQQKIEPLLRSDDEKRLYADMMAMRKNYLASRDAIMKEKKNGNIEQVNALFEQTYLPLAKNYVEAMGTLLAHQRKTIDTIAERINKGNSDNRNLLLALGLLAVGIGAVLARLLARSVADPVSYALKSAQRIAAGDMSQPLHTTGTDEISQLVRAMAQMQQKLSHTIGEIRSASERIATASSEIATGNDDLSQRTEQAASNLQQTASSMVQLNGTVRQTADSARTANQLAVTATGVAARGGEVVAQVVATMDEINASSQRIADIIGVIDGIAFQTNILALNAAVEAARAGEQGRGFAVVAGEVRSLAQRSAEAAREIKSLIGASVERVASGTSLVGDAGRTMQEIVTSVQRVSDMIGDITAAAAEQSEGIDQVNRSVTGLDHMTQQNAALVEQSAAAATSLREQATHLAQSVQGFQLLHS